MQNDGLSTRVQLNDISRWSTQPGQSVLTDSSVRLFGASKLWFGKGREPIGLAKTEKPSSSVSVSSVRCLVSTEVHRGFRGTVPR